MGARILATRLAASMTQMQLAAAVGVTHRQIQKFEGGIDRISCETIQAIATGLGISVASLFDDAPAVDVDPERGEFLKMAAVLTRLPPRLRGWLMQLADLLAIDDKRKT